MKQRNKSDCAVAAIARIVGESYFRLWEAWIMEPKVVVPMVQGRPIKFTLGPFVFERDQYGNWSRNRLNPGMGFREVALTDDAVLLAEEVVRLMEAK